MRWMGRVATGVAIASVLLAYAFFATRGTMSLPERSYPREGGNAGAGYYGSLAEGFLRGQLSLPVTPDPRLASLEDPYDSDQRFEQGISFLFDASLYRGRYYLYFSPLPVLVFYIPVRLMIGHDPHDAVAAAFFSAWAFVAAILFVRRSISAWRLPLGLWIVFIGFANLVTYHLSDVRVYEVAAMAGMACSATWALALLRFHDRPSSGAAAWVGVWLALAIATRPNLLVLIAPTAIVLLRPFRWRVAAAAMIPLLVAGGAYAAYNAARFGSPFELGVKYQLTLTSSGRTLCGVCSLPEATRLLNNTLHYAFSVPRIITEFPYVEPQTARFDVRVMWTGPPEEVVGVFALAPLVMAGVGFAGLLSGQRALHLPSVVMGGSWLVVFGLSTCWWVVSRYSLDFMLLMTMSSVVLIERGLEQMAAWGVRIAPLHLAFLALALYSIVIGILLGFEGRQGAFRREAPDVFRKSGAILGLPVRTR